jgi:AraC family transcriptional regulator
MHAKLLRGHYFGAITQSWQAGGLLLTETRYTPHVVIPPHAHQDAYFCLVRQGNYTECYGARTRSCRPLTVAYHPAEDVHAERFEGSGGRSFNVELNAAWVQRFHECTPRLHEPTEAQGGSPALLALRLYREFRLRDAVAPLAIEGLVLETLAELVRVAAPPRLPPWLVRARQLLHDRFQESFVCQSVAHEVAARPLEQGPVQVRHEIVGCLDYQRDPCLLRRRLVAPPRAFSWSSGVPAARWRLRTCGLLRKRNVAANSCGQGLGQVFEHCGRHVTVFTARQLAASAYMTDS